MQKQRTYWNLLGELVKRDLKVKYRRSFLGYLWSLLNPLMMMGVMTVVFSHFFRANVENYPLYIICGQTLFGFFTESTTMSMNAILSNASLIRKIYVPKYIFPFSRVLSCFVTMSFSLAAILVVMIFTGARFYWTIFLIVIPIFFLFLFCSGIGMMLSALNVYFRDINHLWGVVTLAWMYATPIFYTVDMLPPEMMMLMKLNPMYHTITIFRSQVMFGTLPDAGMWAGCALSGILSFGLGMLIFNKLQNNFILHI